ncbi:hypothetical protein [Parasphingorhabdus sp.]|uniref:hypothetical protein n=1 Tax=Parasphingorhabdus sp. TaxID=2709688 RepID=UPI00329A2874
MKPTFIQSPLWLIAILTLFTTCGHDQDAGETPSPADIYITIDSEGVLAYAQPGDEVPDFISMYNGEADYQARTHGAANLVTELVPGQQVNVWSCVTHCTGRRKPSNRKW